MVLEQSGIATECVCLENRYTSITVGGRGAGGLLRIMHSRRIRNEYTSADIAEVYGYWLADPVCTRCTRRSRAAATGQTVLCTILCRRDRNPSTIIAEFTRGDVSTPSCYN